MPKAYSRSSKVLNLKTSQTSHLSDQSAASVKRSKRRRNWNLPSKSKRLRLNYQKFHCLSHLGTSNGFRLSSLIRWTLARSLRSRSQATPLRNSCHLVRQLYSSESKGKLSTVSSISTRLDKNKSSSKSMQLRCWTALRRKSLVKTQENTPTRDKARHQGMVLLLWTRTITRPILAALKPLLRQGRVCQMGYMLSRRKVKDQRSSMLCRKVVMSFNPMVMTSLAPEATSHR